MISAEVICDSISPSMKRLSTFKLRYPRFIHAEFMTHRMLSRNASSSRAVPTAKLIEEVRSETLRAAPIFWGKNQKGMQAVKELDETNKRIVQDQWMSAAWNASKVAEAMVNYGAHKQIVNRILEPFTHINVVASATEWDNFFGLRLDAGAEPTMQALAQAMWKALGESSPKELNPGDWHLPFIALGEFDGHPDERKVSVARCARVSYESFETGKRSSMEEDLALFEKLMAAQPIHASPAEHQATPDEWIAGGVLHRNWIDPLSHGNFIGWRQYRKMFPGESRAPLPEKFLPF